jgi:thiamine-monophosphate kinase
VPRGDHATVEVQTCSTYVPLYREASITRQDAPGPESVPGLTLAGLGEFGLIGELSSWLPASPGTLVGIGDDAAVLATPDGRVVATTDFLIEGRHFRRDWSSGADAGHKAAARSLADLAAMGADPAGLLLALAAPPDLPVTWAASLARGLAAEAARAGAAVIGGDTARADMVLLAVTGLGNLAGRDPVLRSGAKPGDVVAVAGPLGHAAAGLALLTAGVREDPLVGEHLRPMPPYDAGPEAAALGATAMIDISDGLLADLGHIARASGVLIDLDPDRLGPDETLLAAAASLPSGRTGGRQAPALPSSPGRQALAWVLAGGEDHSLAATFPPGTHLPARWRIIGAVKDRPVESRPLDTSAVDTSAVDTSAVDTSAAGNRMPEARTADARAGRSGYGDVVVGGQPWEQPPGWDHFAAGTPSG